MREWILEKEVKGGGVYMHGLGVHMAQLLYESEIICIASRCNSHIVFTTKPGQFMQ